jgi:hypothetical protein
MTLPRLPDQVFISVEPKNPAIAIRGHELIHHLKNDNPLLFTKASNSDPLFGQGWMVQNNYFLEPIECIVIVKLAELEGTMKARKYRSFKSGSIRGKGVMSIPLFYF